MERVSGRKISGATWSYVSALLIAALSLILVHDPIMARVLALSSAILILWLWESVPIFVPTLLLWAGIPLLLGGYSPVFALPKVLGWAADPVLALFLGGYILARAAHVSGLDQNFTNILLRLAGESPQRLAWAICFGTAFLAMWMSNIAAATLMLATLRPLLQIDDEDTQRLLLLSLVLGANVGGMISPLGSGPNAIALARLEQIGEPMGFVQWITMALPLAAFLMILGLGLLGLLYRGAPRLPTDALGLASKGTEGRRLEVCLVLICAIGGWLTESWHQIPAAVIALTAAAVLFLLGLLKKEDLAAIDGGSLLLIAGGITLGRLLESSGLLEMGASGAFWHEMPDVWRWALLLGIAALLSAVMSNTATATLLIPLASHFSEGPAAPVLIAMACSLGMPFVISTPQNALVASVSRGLVRGRQIFQLGWPLMIIGWLWIVLTGPWFLQWMHGL